MIFSSLISAATAAISSFFTVAGIATAALQAAAGIGISYLAKALAGKPKQQSASNGVSGVQGQLQAAGDVPRQFMLGKGATAGSLIYANAWGNDGETPNAYFTQVIALSDLPIKGLLGIWVNGEYCTFGESTHADFGYPVLEYRKDGKDHLWIKFYDGTQTAADSFLVSRVSSSERYYESTRVGRGIAYAVCTSLVEDTLFTGFPQFLFELDGVRLYDPSKDDTNGGEGDQRYSDQSTWGGDGDNLPAVQIYNLFRGLSYGGEWVYGFQNFAGRRAVAQNWVAQINKSRTAVDGPNGLEPLYRSAGQIAVDTPLADTVEGLLTACQGKVSEVGGFYKLYCGAPDSPAFAFTDDDILSTSEQSFTPFYGLADTVNGISGKYPEPAESWAMKPAPPVLRTDLEAKAGNRRLLSDVSFDFVPHAPQVQRLMNSALLAAQRARRHTFSFGPAFWFIEPGDVGEYTSRRNGYTAKLFEVNGAVDKANLDITVDLTEVDPADYDWNFDTDFKPPTIGPTIFPRPVPQPIIDWFAYGDIIKDINGVSRRPAITLSWDGAMDGVDGVQFEVRNAFGAYNVVYRNRTDNLSAGSVQISQSLLPNTNYEVRGRYIPSTPRDVLWSDWIPVTTPDVRFSVLDFDNSLSELVTGNFQNEADRLDRIVQLVASTVAQAFEKADADKRVVRSELYAQAGSLSASVEQLQQVVVTNEEAFAEFQTTVNASFEDQSASIEENATAVATIGGKLAAQWTVTLDVNGYASGFKAFNDGSTSAIVLSADVVKVAWPGESGGAPVDIFQIANVNGEAKLSFRGDMYADGDITARSLNVATVDAITGDFGTMRTGEVRSLDDLFLIDCTNKQIIISDNT